MWNTLREDLETKVRVIYPESEIRGLGRSGSVGTADRTPRALLILRCGALIKTAALVLYIAVPANAVSGVVYINQASAIAGNVTPGGAPGFPVTISLSGSYKLSGNLRVSDPNKTAIEITADNVNLDLNGFTIQGPCPTREQCPPGTAAASVGVSSVGYHTTTENGNIAGFSSAITLVRPGNRVEHMTISDSSNIGIVVSKGVVRNNVIIRNNYGIVGPGLLVIGNLILENALGIDSDKNTGYGQNVLWNTRDVYVQPIDDKVFNQIAGNLCSGSPCP
jgi:hypothetical protein